MNAMVQSNIDSNEFTDFSIDLNKFAYKVLSDTLYSDKIGSVIREVCRNAADAHDMAGIPGEPIDVTLPTTLNPYFIVKDRGLGLSAAEMDDVYRHYFRSTKDNSYGLGCKSPFAYTDTFTVTTIKDGVKLFYAASLNNDGIPFITKLGEEITSEHNGVEISIPVKIGDIYSFGSKVYEQCAFFDTFPTIVGQPHGTFVDWKSSIWKRIGSIGLVDQTNNTRNSITFIVKKVGYTVDMIDLEDYLDAKEYAFLKILSGSYWFVPEIETTPSREAISFSPKTVTLIKKILHDNHAAIKQELSSEFLSITDKFERYMWLSDHARLADGLGFSSDNDNTKEVILNTHYIELFGSAKDNVCGVVCYRLYRNRLCKELRNSNYIEVKSKADTHAQVLVTEKGLSRSRIMNYLNENSGSGYYIIMQYVVKDKAKFFQDLGCGNPSAWFLSAEDFPLPPKNPNRVAGEKIKAHRWLITSSSFSSSNGIERVFEPLDELEGYYFVVDSMGKSNFIQRNHWLTWQMLCGDTKIYALKQKDLEKINTDNLLPLESEMDALMAQVVTPVAKVKATVKKTITNELYSYTGWKEYPTDIPDPDIKLIQKLLSMDVPTNLEDYVFSVTETDRLSKKVGAFITQLLERLQKKYPLLHEGYYHQLKPYKTKDQFSEYVWYAREKAKSLATQNII